jgi:hypothetical protein
MAVSSNVIRVQSGRERDSCGFLTKALQVKTRPPTIHISPSFFFLPLSLSLSFHTDRHTSEGRETRPEQNQARKDKISL